MRTQNICKSIACALLLLPLSLSLLAVDDNEPLKSDWLYLVKGSRGDTMGAQVREIEDGDTQDMQKITLSIPKAAFSDPDVIEEVVVIGRKPEKPKPLDISYEWVDDYDKDNYGLVIRIGKDSKWPIRLYMYSDTAFQR